MGFRVEAISATPTSFSPVSWSKEGSIATVRNLGVETFYLYWKSDSGTVTLNDVIANGFPIHPGEAYSFPGKPIGDGYSPIIASRGTNIRGLVVVYW